MRAMNLALLAVVAVCVAVAGAPKLGVDTASYDFGSVNEGTVISHSFVLTNLGDATLVITGTRATCGCTTTALAKTSLAPNESVSLDARVDTTSFSGRIQKQIYIDSNDPNVPSAVVQIQGEVVKLQPYNISPGNVHYLFYVIVDLRSPEAYGRGHIVGAVNIPSASLSLWLDILPRSIVLVLYDDTGAESAVKARELRELGFAEARSLAGGFAAWSQMPNAASYMIGSPPGVSASPAGAPAPYEISNGDLRAIFLVLIDLRSPSVYATGQSKEGHFLGALNITSADLPRWQSLLPKDAEIVLYDQAGLESDRQAQLLESAGFSKAHSLAGGIDAWRLAYGVEFLIRDHE